MFAKSAIFHSNDIFGLYLNHWYNSLSWQLLIFDNRAGLLWNILPIKQGVSSHQKRVFVEIRSHTFGISVEALLLKQRLCWRDNHNCILQNVVPFFISPLDAWILYFIRLDLSGLTPSVESGPSSHHCWTSWPITCHLSTLLIVPLRGEFSSPLAAVNINTSAWCRRRLDNLNGYGESVRTLALLRPQTVPVLVSRWKVKVQLETLVTGRKGREFRFIVPYL